jgi:hypothetical protein
METETPRIKVGDQLRDLLQAKITVFQREADDHKACGDEKRYRRSMRLVYEFSDLLHTFNFPAKFNEREDELLSRISELEDQRDGLGEPM